MAPSFLSLANLVEKILGLFFSSAGLTLQTLTIDSKTTIEFWGPPPSPSHKNKQKPSLLLIHGFGPSTVWQWFRQPIPLSKFFNLYVPNLVFFGGSTTSSSYSVENRSEIFQATCMEKLMKKLGVERYSVVGTSYGGVVAYTLAKMFPEKVEKLVIASSAVNMRKSDIEEITARAKSHDLVDMMLPSSVKDFRRFSWMISSKPLNFVPDSLLKDFCQIMFTNRKKKAELLKGQTVGKDNKTNVSPIQQDVMLIWGKEDRIFPMKMAHALKELLGKKTTLKVIQNTGHIPQIEKSKEFNRIIKSFLLPRSRTL